MGTEGHLLYIIGGTLLHVLCEVGEVHIALATESVVECECAWEVVVCLTASSYLEVIAEQWAIVRVSTVFDDEVSALHR